LISLIEVLILKVILLLVIKLLRSLVDFLKRCEDWGTIKW